MKSTNYVSRAGDTVDDDGARDILAAVCMIAGFAACSTGAVIALGAGLGLMLLGGLLMVLALLLGWRG
jgi:hypothetical protein